MKFQKLTDAWEKICKMFFLLSGLMQVVIGSGLAIIVVVGLILAKSGAAEVSGILLAISAVGLCLLFTGTIYSMLFVLFSKDERVFHTVWLVAFGFSIFVVRKWGMSGIDWHNLYFLTASWITAFFLDLMAPAISYFLGRMLSSKKEY